MLGKSMLFFDRMDIEVVTDCMNEFVRENSPEEIKECFKYLKDFMEGWEF